MRSSDMLSLGVKKGKPGLKTTICQSPSRILYGHISTFASQLQTHISINTYSMKMF